jgi:hypothetical protein
MPIGLPGARGKATTWRNGAGAPAVSLGTDGDYYLNTTTGDVYLRSASVYAIVGNIKGSAGSAGGAGLNGAPSPPFRHTGDYVIAKGWRLGGTGLATNQWTNVCYSPELGRFVAVSASGTGTARVATSSDGLTWTMGTASAASPWFAVCWSPQLRLFCAVAQSGNAATSVMTSPDGFTWTSRTAIAGDNWGSICWSPELGRFVAGVSVVDPRPLVLSCTVLMASTGLARLLHQAHLLPSRGLRN